MRRAVIYTDKNTNREVAEPVGYFHTPSLEQPEVKVMGVEELAEHFVMQVARCAESYLKYSPEEVDTDITEFGRQVTTMLVDYNFVDENLTMNSSCFISNHPILLSFILDMVKIRASSNDFSVNDSNRNKPYTTFNYSKFGTHISNLLVQHNLV